MAKEIFLNSIDFQSDLNVVGILSANTFESPNSPNWDSVYSNVQSNSASYATTDFANNKFFALSGGLISGETRFNGNVTIFGDLSSTGTQTFANTIFSTTSSLSVVHVGSGPAVWVGNNGTGDIASFNDLDQGIEVFHIGGANGDFPNVGVKTSAPNKDFTVNGEISASGDIWTSGRILSAGQELLSIIEPSISNIYNTVNANSATNWNYQGTDLKDLSGSWQNTYTDFSANSASYATSNFVQSNFLPITGGAVDGVFEAGVGSISLFVSANKVGINTDLPNEALTVVGNLSASSIVFSDNGNSNNWSSVYTSVQSNSAAWSAATVYIKKYDYVADGVDYSYSGLASEGTLDSDSLWKITRLVFSDVGALSTSGVAQNVTWNERLTATYI
jgi:hypothetical protein